MIALDTNILLRFLIDDESVERPSAIKLIGQQLSREEPGFISAIVLAETFWVLARSYRVLPALQREILRQLLAMPQLVLEHEASVNQALSLPHSDLADCILHEIGRANGCARTMTFDRKFARLDGVDLLT